MAEALRLIGRLVSLALCAAALSGPRVQCQEARSRVSVQAVLVDGELNQKPVPRLAIEFSRLGDSAIVLGVRTGFDGMASAELPQGTYRLSTPKGIGFQGKHYSWNLDVNVGNTPIVLSNDNAKVTAIQAGDSAPADDVAGVLARLRSSLSEKSAPSTPAPAPSPRAAAEPIEAIASNPTAGTKDRTSGPPPVPVPALISQLASPDHGERSGAAKALVEAGDEAVPSVVAALGSSDSEVRARAAWVLGRIKTKEARKAEAALRKMAVSDSSKFVREKCVEALRSMGVVLRY